MANTAGTDTKTSDKFAELVASTVVPPVLDLLAGPTIPTVSVKEQEPPNDPTPTKSECPTCKKLFLKCHLARHILAHTRTTAGHECHMCKKRFGKAFDLSRHIKTVHLNEREFPCPKPNCVKKFGKRGDLTRHIKTVHEKRKEHECKFCFKKFGQKGHMTTHIRTVHEKKKNHQCTFCTRRFGQKSHLTVHMVKQHVEKMGSKSKTSKNPSTKRKARKATATREPASSVLRKWAREQTVAPPWPTSREPIPTVSSLGPEVPPRVMQSPPNLQHLPDPMAVEEESKRLFSQLPPSVAPKVEIRSVVTPNPLIFDKGQIDLPPYTGGVGQEPMSDSEPSDTPFPNRWHNFLGGDYDEQETTNALF